MNKVPQKCLDNPQLLQHDAKGRLLLSAKAFAHIVEGRRKTMLSVYAFGVQEKFPIRYVVVRATYERHEVGDRAKRTAVMRTMCDLAAVQLGGVEYALREAIK